MKQPTDASKWRVVRLTTHQKWIGAVLLVMFALYLWTGASTYPITFAGQGVGPAARSAPGLGRAAYNLLTTALLHGHLYLPIHPDAQFLHLKHPYRNGGTIQAKRYHDLMWHGGRFYSAWGPSPVLLFLLVRIVSLGSLAMSQTLAVVLYLFIGLVAAVGLLHLIVRRLIPATPNWVLVIATIGIALTNVALFLLRRPAQYEVAISGGYAFAMVGLWLLGSSVWSDRRWRLKLALASTSLGLAVAARPTMLAGGLALVAALVWMIRCGGRDRRSVLIGAVAPFAACGVVLALYNVARFGSPLNLGYAYQLASPAVDGRKINDPAYLLPGLFGYLLMPPRLTVAFPYVSLLSETQNVYPLTLPASYAGGTGGWPLETASGLLPAVPVTLLLFCLPALWWRRDQRTRGATAVATLLTSIGVLALVLVTLGMWLTTERYEADYISFFLIAAFLVWAVLLARFTGSRRLRGATAAVGVGLTGLGAAVGLAISLTGPFDLLQKEHPRLFGSLQNSLSPIPTFVSKILNRPMIASVRGPYVQVPTDVAPFDLQEAGATVTLARKPTTFTLIVPSTGKYFLEGETILQSRSSVHGLPYVKVAGPGSTSYVARPPNVGSMRFPLRLHSGLNSVSLTVPSSLPGKPFLIFAGIDLSS